jgi:hypothetical protein
MLGLSLTVLDPKQSSRSFSSTGLCRCRARVHGVWTRSCLLHLRSISLLRFRHQDVLGMIPWVAEQSRKETPCHFEWSQLLL